MKAVDLDELIAWAKEMAEREQGVPAEGDSRDESE